jgi:serine protease Do
LDYRNTASVRRAHRGGNALVIVLCGILVLLLGAGAFFALTNDSQGWNKLMELGQRAHCPFLCDTEKAGQPADEKTGETTDPVWTEPAAETPRSVEGSFGLSSIPDVVDEVSPGVIGVLNYQVSGKRVKEPRLAGSGSGFVYSADGYIITNHHVVEGADLLKVSLKNGEIVDATLVGGDVQTDVAVLKIEAEGLKALPIGDSSAVRVGEFVLAIGDPISADELSGSVTFGIVSALSRQINIEGFQNEYLQTDAAVNPGNSGGPLINMRGEVIGVTSAKYTSAGFDEYGQTISSEGIGFALPINNVMQIATELIEKGTISRPGIGISVSMHLDEETGEPIDVYIAAVTEGSPADQAGAKVNDKLLLFDGQAFTTTDEFVQAVRAKKPGETIVLTVERDGEQIELTISVGDLNEIHK